MSDITADEIAEAIACLKAIRIGADQETTRRMMAAIPRSVRVAFYNYVGHRERLNSHLTASVLQIAALSGEVRTLKTQIAVRDAVEAARKAKRRKGVPMVAPPIVSIPMGSNPKWDMQ
jgi:hypothetical protein